MFAIIVQCDSMIATPEVLMSPVGGMAMLR